MPQARPFDSPQATREKWFAAAMSVASATGLTAIKVVVGLLSGSLGILAEAAHSALDMAAAVVTYFAVRYSGQPADREHTYGHGKMENFSALFETLLLLVTCVWIVYEAGHRLLSHAGEPPDANAWGFGVMAVSIVVNTVNARRLKDTADKYASQALEADALHFATDIWSSWVVVGGLALVWLAERLGPAWAWLALGDSLAALGVAAIVIWVSLELGRRAVGDLLDAVPPGLREQLDHAARVTGVGEVRRVRIRRSGPELFADVELTVDGNPSLERAHQVADEAEAAIEAALPGCDVVVHVEPAAGPSCERSGVLASVRRLAARHGLGAHGIRIYDVDGRRCLELHLEIDDRLTVDQAHARAETFEAAVREALPSVADVVTHLEPDGEVTSTAVALPVGEDEIRRALLEWTTANDVRCHLHEVNARASDGRICVSLHCELDGDLSIAEAHRFTEDAESALRHRIPALGRVVIHVEPRPRT